MKYEYLLHTWGGFYNENNKIIHKKEAGYFWFYSKEERSEYINELKSFKEQLDEFAGLMLEVDEGYHLRTMVTLHRVIKYKDVEYYSNRDMYYGCSYKSAIYKLENSWYPGFNDYPLGEDFVYYDDVETVQEWITGAFSLFVDDDD